jgi:hypothetical protein
MPALNHSSGAILELHMDIVSPGLDFDPHQKSRDGWKIRLLFLQPISFLISVPLKGFIY